MSDFINVVLPAIQEDKMDIVLKFFGTLLDQEAESFKFEEPAYYYHYESDSNVNLFEELMRKHLIAIEAYSLEEANILDIILHTLIIGHAGVVSCITDESDQEVKTAEAFAKAIKGSDHLSMYQDYKSEYLKDCNNADLIFELGKRRLPSEFLYPQVFNYERIRKLLQEEMGKASAIAKLKHIFSTQE